KNTRDESVLLRSKKVQNAIKTGEKAELSLDVNSMDRTFGTLLGAEITRKHHEGLPEDTIVIDCKGSGGQSFGAFIPCGLTLKLSGDSNDYFGKGLSGGKLVIKAPDNAKYDPDENIIIGNVALYGATSGKVFIAGMAGERFAIRNSGAVAVVEGVGEHGCEYMTGGKVVILGDTGKNFAAGMSGGVAYVLDEKNTLYKNLNKQLVSMEEITDKNDVSELKKIITEHVEATGSAKGKMILSDFDQYIGHFKKIIPEDYKKIMRLIAREEEKGADPETAKIEAFRAFTSGEDD
ncbi:MAG: glutamate synthase subunit alpha, partial [Lachnospiraceae bacterium]|nr:glutamate synthase subunit alpha [Lachnospiraceae bacterium]